MTDIFFASLSALWLGILTSISPCPLATNIAAVSFLSKKINHPKLVLYTGLAYAAGRMFTYAVLGALIIASLVKVPFLANLLQRYMNKVLGPLLFIVGVFLLDIIKLNIGSFSISHEKQNKLAEYGIIGSFALGVIFALSFCPIAAALFFGSLISLAVSTSFGIILPFFYGIGTAIPVLVFAIGISLGARSFSRWFTQAATLERHMRKITGVIFIVIGIYFIWSYIVINLVQKGA